MKRGTVTVATILAVLLVGCSSDSSVSEEKDKNIRNNMTREFTPEEIAKMGGSAAQKGPQPPAAPPGKKKLGTD